MSIEIKTKSKSLSCYGATFAIAITITNFYATNTTFAAATIGTTDAGNVLRETNTRIYRRDIYDCLAFDGIVREFNPTC